MTSTKVIALWTTSAGIVLLVAGMFFPKMPAGTNTRQDVVQALEKELGGRLVPATNELFARGDVEGVGLYIRASEIAGVPVPEALYARYREETIWWKAAGRTAVACGGGVLTGNSDELAGITCSVVTDLMFVGDVRDGAIEAFNLLRGEDPDYLVLGLAGVGIAMDLAIPAAGGTAVGPKVGVSILKVGVKSAAISPSLVREISAVAKQAVDISPVARLGTGDLADWPGISRAVAESFDKAKLAPLTEAVGQLNDIIERGSPRDAIAVVKAADSLGDIRAGEKLSRTFGKDTAAVVKVLGQRAFRVAEAVAVTAGALASILIGAILSSVSALLWMVLAFGWLWRRARSSLVEAQPDLN